MLKYPVLRQENARLGNGLEICMTGDFPRRSPLVTAVFLAGCGLQSETPATSGITHALEHMLFKGTEKYDNFETTSIVNSLGGSLDAYTTSDSLCLELTAPPANFAKALDVLAELALRPTLPARQLELEKKVIIDEILYYEDDPEDLVMLALEEDCFKGSCYGRQILGSRESVSGFTRADFRRYHSSYFTPENCRITVAGNFDGARMLSLIEERFGPGAWKPSRTGPSARDYEGAFPRSGNTLIKKPGKFTQNYAGCAFRLAPSTSAPGISAFLLAHLYSSLRSSPLPYLMREASGKAASISADLIFKRGAWMFAAVASCGSGRAAEVCDAMEAFSANITSLVTPQVFDNAKKAYLLEYLQEIESAKAYCNELAAFDHVLGRGAYNSTLDATFSLRYEDFLEFAASSVERAPRRTVRLVSVADRSVSDRARYHFNGFGASRAPEGAAFRPEPMAPYASRRSGPSGEGLSSGECGRAGFVSVPGGASGYSTASLLIGGGVSASVVPGDAYVLAELFGRRTRAVPMYSNFLAAESMGMMIECNAYLDYLQVDALCAGEWDERKVAYLRSLFEGFDHSATMLSNARTAVRRMVRSSEDDVFEYSFWNFVRLLFDGHPYSRAIFGRVSEIEGVTAEDVASCYRGAIGSPKVFLSCAGPASGNRRLVEGIGGIFPPEASRKAKKGRAESPAANFSTVAAESVIRSRQSQCTLMIGGPAPPANSRSSMPFVMASYILSDYTGKRLWTLREDRGLCYNVFSDYLPLSLGGMFFCYANTDERKLGEVAECAKRELTRFVQDGATKREIADAKRQMIKKVETAMNSPYSLARMAGQSLFYGKSLSEFMDYRDRIGSISSDEILSAARAFMAPEGLVSLRVIPR